MSSWIRIARGALDVEDSWVEQVTREANAVVVVFSRANIRCENGEWDEKFNARVRFESVSKEATSYFTGSGVTTPCSVQSIPLDYIQYVAHEGKEIQLGGQRNNAP